MLVVTQLFRPKLRIKIISRGKPPCTDPAVKDLIPTWEKWQSFGFCVVEIKGDLLQIYQRNGEILFKFHLKSFGSVKLEKYGYLDH